MLKLPQEEISLWRKTAAGLLYPELTEDLEVDVAIVGGGISGLNAAYLLKQAGLKVAVVEKDRIGRGTTGSTTGKVTFQHNLFYAEPAERLGIKTARAYAGANQEAFEQIKYIIKTEKINCGWSVDDNYVFTANPTQVKQFKKEAEICLKLGLPASYQAKTPLPFKVEAAVKFENQAKMNAQAYINKLAAMINGQGSCVFENSRIVSIKDSKPASISTVSNQIIAHDVIIATSVPTFPLLARISYGFMEYPHRSYIVAAQTDLKLQGMYISPDNNHYSILPVEAGGKRYILIGGANHVPGLKLSSKNHYQKLADYGQQHFAFKKINYRWSGRDYLAYDELPVVGKLYPWSKHLYTMSAYRKWGLTNSMAAARILRDLILGLPNPAAKEFNPHRKSATAAIPYAVAKYFKEN